MSQSFPFTPQSNTTLTKATTTASVAVQPSTGNASGLLVTQVGSVPVYIAIGSSSVSAALPTTSTPASGIPVHANTAQAFGAKPGAWISAITTSGTVDVYATAGEGM